MSPRLTTIDTTRWLWCLLALSACPGILAVTVHPPVSGPATVEAQAKFFQYRHLPSLEDFDQGHRLGSEKHFTERHERSRPSQGLFSAKVRWGDKHGGYGEHYWDLNHAGSSPTHAAVDNNDDQKNQYDHEYKYDANDPYDATVETGEYNPNYGDDEEYDAEKSARSDSSLENNRAKRAHVKIKAEKRIYRSTEDDDEDEDPERQTRNKESDSDEIDRELDETQDVQKINPRKTRKNRRQHKPALKELNLEEDPEEEDVTIKPKTRKNQDNTSDATDTSEEPKNKEPAKAPRASYDTARKVNDNFPGRQGRTIFNPYKTDVQRINDHYGARNLQSHYVPYEDVGLRQRQADASPAASTPFRLFLEPSTGHVIDRATGLAYVLQPLAPANNFDTYN